MADLKTSEESPVSDVSLNDLVRLALAGGGNAKATISQIADAILALVPDSGNSDMNAIRSQVQNNRGGRFLQSDGMVRDPLRVGLASLTVGSLASVTDNSAYNAWPTIERMSDGRLIIVYTSGAGHNSDNSGNAVGKIGVENKDGSITWGTEFTVYNHATLGVNVYGIFRTVTGRLIASLVRVDYTSRPSAVSGIVYSDDNGATWSAWVDTGTASGFAQESISAGGAVQLGNGDLLIPIEGTDSGTLANRSVKIIRSSDDGLTWGSPVTLIAYATYSRAHYETRLLVLPDESVLAFHRVEDGVFTPYLQLSTDGGGTWGTPYAGPTETSGAPTMLLLSTGTIIVGVRCQTAGANYGGFVAYTSRDSGVTWVGPKVVDSSMVAGGGIMEYAAPVELRDGRVLFVYGVQPTSSTTNSDIKTIPITEDTQRLTREVPQLSKSAAYTLVMGDANTHILHPSADTTARTFTIPANSSVPYRIGTTLTFVNQNAGGVITIAITTDTMRLAGAGTTGSRTLAANGMATALKITATEWIISGTGLT